MTTAAQLSMRTYAGLQWPSVSHKGRIALLAREFGWSHRRTRSIYNGENGVSLRAGEQAVIDRWRRKKEAENVRASQAEYRALEDRLARVEALLATIDEEFFRPDVDAIREQARRSGVVSRHAGAAPEARGAVDGPEDFRQPADPVRPFGPRTPQRSDD
jgi:hypothetical protein